MLPEPLLYSWLELVCQMVQGTRQSVIISTDQADADTLTTWPRQTTIDPRVIAAARKALAQNQPVIEALDTVDSQKPDNPGQIIARPIQVDGQPNRAVSLQVFLKPGQQAVVLQLLGWAQAWLALLADTQNPHQQAPQTGLRTVFWRKRGGVITALLICALLVGLMTGLQGNYRISAPALLEGSIERVVVAPFDGFIEQGLKKAGDTVDAGEQLAAMDADELELQQQSFRSQLNESERQYRQALSRREMAQASIFKSQVSQARAQLDLTARKLERSIIRSPLKGYIISGDLSGSRGAPVKLGEVLFEVAPLNAFRLVLHVDERDVAEVRVGRPGVVTLRALPEMTFDFEVTRVSPVFEEQLDSIVYRVEGELQQHHPAQRPGMQGIGKIEIGRKSLAWIYLHEVQQAISLWLWKWLH